MQVEGAVGTLHFQLCMSAQDLYTARNSLQKQQDWEQHDLDSITSRAGPAMHRAPCGCSASSPGGMQAHSLRKNEEHAPPGRAALSLYDTTEQLHLCHPGTRPCTGSWCHPRPSEPQGWIPRLGLLFKNARRSLHTHQLHV